MYFNGTILAVLDNFFSKQAYYVKVLYQNAKAAAPKLPKLPEAVESEMDDVLKVFPDGGDVMRAVCRTKADLLFQKKRP
ncbi:unnamed protein product [Mucor hiemalis]